MEQIVKIQQDRFKSIILIITLSMNDVNPPIKSQRSSNQIRKQDPNTYCLQESPLKYKVKYMLADERMGNNTPCGQKRVNIKGLRLLSLDRFS